MPKHGGPDGQGLPKQAFDELLRILQDITVNDQDAESVMMLGFGASEQQQWNEEYRPQLLKLCIDSNNK